RADPAADAGPGRSVRVRRARAGCVHRGHGDRPRAAGGRHAAAGARGDAGPAGRPGGGAGRASRMEGPGPGAAAERAAGPGGGHIEDPPAGPHARRRVLRLRRRRVRLEERVKLALVAWHLTAEALQLNLKLATFHGTQARAAVAQLRLDRKTSLGSGV